MYRSVCRMTTLQEESIVYPSVDYLISDNNLCVGS